MPYRASTASGGSSSTAAGVVDGAVQDGDLQLALIIATAGATTITSTPAGWSLVRNASPSGFKVWLYLNTRASGESSTPAWGLSGSTGWTVDIWSGSGYAGIHLETATTNTGANALAVSLTPTIDGCTLVIHGGADTGTGGQGRTWTVTGGTPPTERIDQNDSTAYRVVADETLSGGAGVAQSRTVTITGATTPLHALLIALEPSGTAHTRDVVDAIGVTDTAARASTSARDVVDPVGVTDAATRTAAADRPIVDQVGTTDALSYTNGTVHTRDVVDPIGLTDTAVRSTTTARPVVDPVALGDVVARTTSMVRGVVDAIGLTDSRTISAGAGDPGVPLLPTALGPLGRLVVEAAFGADLSDSGSWEWVDITSDVRQSPGIAYSRGRGEEASASQPATMTLTLTNTSSAYSLGPVSAFYPHVRRGTPVRVRVAPADGVLRVAFQGEAVGWTPAWDLTGRIRTVQLEAAGNLRRLIQGARPVISPMRRAGLSRTDLAAYWPCEEGAASTTITPAVGAEGMTVAGFPEFAAFDGFASSLPVPVLKGSAWTGSVTPYVATGAAQVRALVAFPTADQVGGVMLRVFTTGSASRWDLIYEPGQLGLISGTVYDRFGNVLADTNGIGFAVNEPPLARRWSLEMVQVGGDVTWRFSTVSASDGAAAYWNGPTLSGRTLGTVAAVVVNPDRVLDDVAVGHVTVGKAQTDIYDDSEEFRAHVGEYNAGTGTGRVIRLAIENLLTFTVVGSGEPLNVDVDRLGPQPIATLVELLRECETADQGTLYDGSTAGLVLRTRRARENQSPTLTIDAGALELSPPFGAVDDDQRTRNRVEARQAGGSSVVVEDVDGPLGTAAIGVYEESLTVNTLEPAALALYGGWLIARGTCEGYRYPTITLDLRATPQHAAAWLGLRPGHRLDVTDVDAVLPGHPGGTLQLMVEGTADTISAEGWTGVVRCSPYEPWRIATAAADAGDVGEYVARADSDGSTLAATVPGNTTSISVATPTGPLWTTTADDYPLSLEIAGREVTVTGCSDGTTPQTMTITPVPFELPAGSLVRLWRPTRTAL